MIDRASRDREFKPLVTENEVLRTGESSPVDAHHARGRCGGAAEIKAVGCDRTIQKEQPAVTTATGKCDARGGGRSSGGQ